MIHKEKLSFNDPNHTFVIAEAGSNWKAGSYDEDLRRAFQLIEVASKSGADAIKFQTYKAETVYVPNAGQIKYLSESEKNCDIHKLFDKLSMPYKMLQKLSEHCKKFNIMFMSTPFSVEDAKQVDPFVSIHKVASYEINHIRLLEYLASTKKPILLSTGASTFDEIDFAMEIMKKNNSGSIGLLQCTSKYPSPISSLNLSVIPNLKKRYTVAIGFSDHSLDPLIGPIMAIGNGATVVEKHFTLDKNLPGPDHSFALDPIELSKMIKSIREADLSKGNGEKIILPEEKELRQFATRSIQAIKKIHKDDILKEGENIDILRPGNQKRGAEARFLDQINGKHASHDIEIGEGVLESDCE